MIERQSADRYKSRFTADEDIRLLEIISQCGCRDWSEVAVQMKGRNARQCRERWNNYVNPSITMTPWTAQEEQLLESKFAEIGPQWQIISGFLPGRSKNHVRNHWMTKQRRLNKKRKNDIEAIAPEREPQLSPVSTPDQPETAQELFKAAPKDGTFWDIISLDYL
jgi:hypothetical protein